jgi:hypothetical protein
MEDKYDGWEDGYPVVRKPIDEDDVSEVFAPEANDPKALKALLDFSINNKDLDKLASLIGAFNPFKVLGIQDFEIKHSNVLAWLIDPGGHHGLGDTLFKNLLLQILKDSQGGDVGNDFPQINRMISADFSDLRVSREWRNIDLIAVSKINKVALVIENKIHAGEEETQLARYAAIVKEKYKGYEHVFVFLTLDGSSPKGSDLYLPFKHEQIRGIVKSTVELHRDYMHSKVYDFILQYLQILEEKTMQSTEFIDICGKLYREHSFAIQMITTYGKPKLPMSNIRDFHTKTDTVSVHSGKNSIVNYYTFIPKEWDNIVPKTNMDKSDQYLVFVYLNLSEYENQKITMSLRVGEFPDPAERSEFVAQLSKAARADESAKLTVKGSSKKYMTVFSKTISLKDESGGDYGLDDYEAVTDKLVEVYNSDDVQKALEVVDSVVQKFAFRDKGK